VLKKKPRAQALALREENFALAAGIAANWHVGVDEAGRGCLAGPVVSAAVLAPPAFDFLSAFPGLTDSKALSAAKRESLRAAILGSPIIWGLGFSWPQEIDRVNILNATFRAMTRAVCSLFLFLERHRLRLHMPDDLPRVLPLYIDGTQKIRPCEWQAGQRVQRGFILPRQYALVKGDAVLPAISAASVLAKTRRDKLMRALDRRYPGYALALHKGYGTKAHMEAIERLGPSPLHRKTFAPCARRGTTPEQGELL
jgi:ribonuclease HII